MINRDQMTCHIRHSPTLTGRGALLLELVSTKTVTDPTIQKLIQVHIDTCSRHPVVEIEEIMNLELLRYV